MTSKASLTIVTLIFTSISLISIPKPYHAFQFSSQEAEYRLYTEKDDVLILKADTFKPTVFNDKSNQTFVVQFYNSYCGHCQAFAPTYKELATRVRNWTSVVRIAAIDCSVQENTDTCSENKIEGYPTIFIFPPNAKFGNPNDAPLSLRSLNIDWTIDEIEETITDYVSNLTNSHRQYPLVVDALQPITDGALQDIRRIYPVDSDFDIVNEHRAIQDLMFVVESEKSYLGKKLIIEYFRISSKLELRRILLTNKALLKKILNKVDFEKLNDIQPLLLRINHLKNGHKAQILVRGEAGRSLSSIDESQQHDFVYKRFGMFFEHYYSVELKEMGRHENENKAEISLTKSENLNHFDRRPEAEPEIFYLVHNDPASRGRVFAMDLLKGINYMITHEMRIKGDLSPKEFNTVRNMLTILKKFLPLDRWDPMMSKFVENFRTRLDDNRLEFERNGVTGQEMKDLLDQSGADSVRLRYSKENWISCYESDRKHKGYTCSLWLLFHSLTVGEYTKTAPVNTRPTLVLTTMRDYITRFLGCTVCASNFAKETENMESNLVHRNSSVLWLWNTHNHVNQRLNEKQSENRKSLADVIFPTIKRCHKCFKNDREHIGVDGKNLEDIQWILPNVFEHLIQSYLPDQLVSPVEQASLLSKNKGKVNYDVLETDLNKEFSGIRRLAKSSSDMNRSVEQWNLQSIFSTSDMSICLSLYLFCIVMLAIVCVSMNPKWKRFKTR